MEKLGTKAETLQKLYQRLKNAEVLPQLCFTVNDWNEKKQQVLENYEKLTWKDAVVVRSSSQMEDTATQSFAGMYESVLNVTGKENFIHAVEQVIASYNIDTENQFHVCLLDQVLVQPMLQQIGRAHV